MMELTTTPPQSAYSYTPAGDQPAELAENAPKLGTPIPGTTGGLPALAGLSIGQNPMAQQLQSQGRGEDTMLVHMTPNEVNSLQGLAMAAGGSLTINPHTGLPEAGWLGKLLPTILGGIGMAFGIPPIWMGALGAVGGTAITGDLKQGLMAGLGADGGASLAGGLGLGGAISKNALGLVGTSANPVVSGVAANAGNVAKTVAPAVTTAGTGSAYSAASHLAPIINSAGATTPIVSALAPAEVAAGLAAPSIATPAVASGFFQGFGESARAGLGTGILSKAAVPLATTGLLNSVSNAFSPSGFKTADGKIDNSYQGPYTYQKREATFAPSTQDLLSSSKERDYFEVDQPEVYNTMGQLVQPGSETAPGTKILRSVLNPNAKENQPMYSFETYPYMQDPKELRRQQFARLGSILSMAGGGEVSLRNGSFVMDARTVSELGNGSSSAGQELLARLGGRPVRGPGDGVSDSVPARIGRNQPARVARDEVIFDPGAVRNLGKGNQKKGAQKLYAMMDKAHKARKRADRGTDTKLRRGLA